MNSLDAGLSTNGQLLLENTVFKHCSDLINPVVNFPSGILS